MPWIKQDLMSLRGEFVHLVDTERLPLATLCQRFGISRKTGYKWLARYRDEGRAGLADRSRRPRRLRPTIPAVVRDALLAERQAHPCWGARKLRQRVVLQGLTPVPACSTITAFLRRGGLLGANQVRGPAARSRFEHPVPNQLWQMDFKGAVPTVAGPAHPLTILDDHSRFNVGLRVLPNQQTATVQQALIATFRCYGLPDRLLVDNGSPWGSDAVHRDTPLTVWLWRMGVAVTHSRPYHPQTLGKDERFHGTLTREVLRRTSNGAIRRTCRRPWTAGATCIIRNGPMKRWGWRCPPVATSRVSGAIPRSCRRSSMTRGPSCGRCNTKASFRFRGRCISSAKPFGATPWGCGR